jgi:hypothetical protein
MDEWRYVKAAIRWGLAGALVCWMLGWGANFSINFSFFGSGAFLVTVLEDKNKKLEL